MARWDDASPRPPEEWDEDRFGYDERAYREVT
jgi:hypothetical protein